MTHAFDQYGINDMTMAVDRAMSPRGHLRTVDADTIFVGGGRTSLTQRNELARFGLSKNYKLVYPIFDVEDPSSGPLGFNVVVTDGETQSVCLSDGRLWKRDRSSAAVLLFPAVDILVRLSSKHLLTVRAMRGSYHDHGYDLAREALMDDVARKRRRLPVVSTIGSAVVVMDASTLQRMSAAAA